MFRKIEQIKLRHNELQQFFSENESFDEEYNELSKEYYSLLPLKEKIDEYETCLKEKEDAILLLNEAEYSDEEFYNMTLGEIESLEKRETVLTKELELLLIPEDPDDKRNVIVEIRSGTGGEEAALFVYDLFRMYSMFAQKKGFSLEILSSNATELGGFKEVVFLVSGKGAFGFFKFESGTHRVQRVPETESNGKKQTSAVTVAVLPEAQAVDIDINPADLQIDTFRSSGAGGQHVNKTESAIRITHLPTGTVVECQDERSQHKNKEKAMRVLRSRILQAEKEKQKASIDSDRKSQVGSGDRSERIRTYNFHQNRFNDHRINLTLYNLKNVLDGELDEVIDKLKAHYASEEQD